MWTALIVGLIILIIILALIYVAKQSEPEPRPAVYNDYDEDEVVTTTTTTTTNVGAKEVYNGYEIEGVLTVQEDSTGECFVNDPVGGQRQYVDRDCDMYQDDDQKFWRLQFLR